MTKVEITKTAYKALLGDNPIALEVEEKEHFRAFHFVNSGVHIKQVDSHISLVTQYYVYDINV